MAQLSILKAPITDRAGRFSFLKAATLVVLSLPALALIADYGMGKLGPMPVKEAVHVAGEWAIRILIASLAVTPLMRICAWPRLVLVRRMIGVTAFAYALLHFVLYVADAHFDLLFVGKEIALRIYLTIGFVALLGLALLAATSTDAAVRKLGRKWKMLHSIVYGLAVLGILHFFMQSKIDVTEAVLMAGLFLLLMTYRAVIARRLPLGFFVLSGAAVTASLLTAASEMLWYGLATGVSPWQVGIANFAVAYGVRPAVVVLAVGMTVALLALRQRVFAQAINIFIRRASAIAR